MTEPTKQRDGDQPLPTAGRECVQDALIAEIQARKELGIQRYGSVLMTHNGRDSLRDAREEAVDLAVYLMQVELEDRDAKAELAGVREERLKYGTECNRLAGELEATHNRARTLVRRLKDVKAERDTARAQVVAVRATAADMRTWCSPQGLADHYANCIELALDGQLDEPQQITALVQLIRDAQHRLAVLDPERCPADCAEGHTYRAPCSIAHPAVGEPGTPAGRWRVVPHRAAAEIAVHPDHVAALRLAMSAEHPQHALWAAGITQHGYMAPGRYADLPIVPDGAVPPGEVHLRSWSRPADGPS